jgi:hypothetical protein
LSATGSLLAWSRIVCDSSGCSAVERSSMRSSTRSRRSKEASVIVVVGGGGYGGRREGRAYGGSKFMGHMYVHDAAVSSHSCQTDHLTSPPYLPSPTNNHHTTMAARYSIVTTPNQLSGLASKNSVVVIDCTFTPSPPPSSHLPLSLTNTPKSTQLGAAPAKSSPPSSKHWPQNMPPPEKSPS